MSKQTGRKEVEIDVATFAATMAETVRIDRGVTTGSSMSAPSATDAFTSHLPTTVTLSDQASSFVTALLPPQGFSLVNLEDLQQLQVVQAETETVQQQVDSFEKTEGFEDGVNLVVTGTHWLCKDCNVKQPFGRGESMDDHLRNKHKIDNKAEVSPDVPSASVNTGDEPVLSKNVPAADVITSVYTVPPNSVSDQDQAMDTLIIFDDSTTLQVITKPSEDKLVYSSRSESTERRATEGCLPLSTLSSDRAVSCPSVPSTPVAALTRPKLIPVIPALPSNYSVLGSSQAPVLPGDCYSAESDSTTLQCPTKPPQTLRKGIAKVQAEKKSPQLVNSLPSSSTICEPQTHQNLVEPSPETNLQTTNHTNTENYECSVQLQRLTPDEILQIQCVQKSAGEQIKEGKLLPEGFQMRKNEADQATGRKRHVVAGWKRLGKSPDSQLPSKKTRNSCLNDSAPVHNRRAAHYKYLAQTIHSSFGRKIKKPARYVTMSDSEGENVAKSVISEAVVTYDVQAPEIAKEDKSISKTVLSSTNNLAKVQHEIQSKKASKNTASLLVAKKSKEEKYTCQECGRKFRFKNKLKKHVELYAGQEMQQCSMCTAKLHNHDLLNAHIYHVHKTKESTLCNACGKVLGSKRNLLHHLLSHPSSKGQTIANLVKDSCSIHQCSLCSETIVEGEGRVEKHYMMHKKTSLYSCQKCEATFKRKLDLYNHLKTHGIPKEDASFSEAGQELDGEQNADCLKMDFLLSGHQVQDEQETTDRSNRKSLFVNVQQDQTKSETEVSDFDDIASLQSNGHRQTTGKTVKSKKHKVSPARTLGLAEGHTDEAEIQGEEFQPVERIIAQSVHQVMKYEENELPSSTIPITVTFIPSEVGKDGTRNTESANSTQISQPLFRCQLCSKHFATKKLLYLHLKSHGAGKATGTTAEDENSISTLEENGTANQPIDLSQGVPFGIPCCLVKLEGVEGQKDYLKKSFTTTPEGLVVPGKMHYTCTLCEREFQSENKARRHINRFSKQQSILQCNVCPCKFHNLDLFNVHYAYVHQLEGAATCMTCSLEFNNKGDFLTHLGNSPQAHPLSLKLGLKTFLQDACGVVACSVCQKSVWNYPASVANHMKLHKSFACPICQQGFPYKYAFMIHLQAHSFSKYFNTVGEILQSEPLQSEQSEQVEQVNNIHSIVLAVESADFVEGVGKFTCPLCRGEVWHQRKNIHRHLDLHARRVLHSVRKGRYFCPDCGEDLAVTDHTVHSHLALHGHTVVQFTCVFCTQVFSSFEEYKNHEVKKHWLNMYFEKSVCEVCGKEVANRQELKKHVQLHEETQGLFSCSRCNQTFRFESKLQKHMAKHDSGRDSYACQFCGKLYMTKISLDRHEQVDHGGIKDFKHKCKLCDAQFINATHLRDHVTNKHSNRASYMCRVCGQGFKHLSTYVRHRRVLHGGDTPYVCKECGRKFPVKKDLQRHMIEHTGVNPFQCPACHKCFSVERTMQEHYDFIHRGVVRFACVKCGSKFPRKRNLTRHMTTCRMTAVAVNTQ